MSAVSWLGISDIPDVGSRYCNRSAALHIASHAGNISAIQWLLAHGATVDLRNSEGETPLHVAACCLQDEAINALLAAGANINLNSAEYSHTPLLYVLGNKPSITPREIKTIELLLDRGADINYGFDDIWIGTLIGQATQLNSFELVEILIARGARIDHVLRYTRDYVMTKFLLDRGAPIICEPSKESAITNAAGGDHFEVMQLLCSRANDTDLANSREALNLAAAHGRLGTVKLLIEYGFDVNAITEGCVFGETPLIAVCQTPDRSLHRSTVAKFLLEHGADVNARNKNGTTAAEMLLKDDELMENADLKELLTKIQTK